MPGCQGAPGMGMKCPSLASRMSSSVTCRRAASSPVGTRWRRGGGSQRGPMACALGARQASPAAAAHMSRAGRTCRGWPRLQAAVAAPAAAGGGGATRWMAAGAARAAACCAAAGAHRIVAGAAGAQRAALCCRGQCSGAASLQAPANCICMWSGGVRDCGRSRANCASGLVLSWRRRRRQRVGCGPSAALGCRLLVAGRPELRHSGGMTAGNACGLWHGLFRT